MAKPAGWQCEYLCGCLSAVVGLESSLPAVCLRHGAGCRKRFQDFRLPGMEDPAITSAAILQAVRRRLVGFELRQKIRKERRDRRNGKLPARPRLASPSQERLFE